jgi:hypothetical protein
VAGLACSNGKEINDRLGLGGPRLIKGRSVQVTGKTDFYFEDSTDHSKYFPLPAVDTNEFLAGAKVQAPPGYTVTSMGTSVRREMGFIGSTPSSDKSGGTVVRMGEVFVLTGRWKIEAAGDAPEGRQDFRVEFPAVAAWREKLNASTPHGKTETSFSVVTFSRQGWWITSLVTGASGLLGLLLLSAFVASVAAQLVLSGPRGVKPVAPAAGWVAVLEVVVGGYVGYYALTLLGAGLADLWEVHTENAVAVLAGTNLAALCLCRLCTGEWRWSRVWAVAVCPGMVLLGALALAAQVGLPLLGSLTDFRSELGWAVLAVMPGTVLACSVALLVGACTTDRGGG